MTETTSVDHAHSGRLTRTRLTVRTAIAIERLWPLLLPVLVIVALFVSLSWLGVFRLMPGTLRQVVAVLFAIAALAALYPLRFFRKPGAIEIDRRIERANRLQHNPVSVQSDRPSGRQASFRRCAVARTPAADGRATAQPSPATCRAPVFRNATLGAARRGGAAVRRRLRLFVRPAWRQGRGRLPRRRRRSTPCRRASTPG